MLSDVVEEVVLEHGGEVNVIYLPPILLILLIPPVLYRNNFLY